MAARRQINDVRAAFVALWVATAVGVAGMIVAIASVMSELGSGADSDIVWMFGLLATVAMAYATVGLLIAGSPATASRRSSWPAVRSSS